MMEEAEYIDYWAHNNYHYWDRNNYRRGRFQRRVNGSMKVNITVKVNVI